MIVRVTTLAGVGGFHHGGLHVGSSWSDVDVSDAEVARDLVTYNGRVLTIHPDDRAAFVDFMAPAPADAAPAPKAKK